MIYLKNVEEIGKIGLIPLDSLVCADCLEAMRCIPDKSIDMVCCDLPYGSIACKWDVVIPFELLWEQYERIITDTGAIVLMASQPFTSSLIMSNLDMFKYECIWEKSRGSNFVHAKYQPLKVHENICVFSRGGSAQGSRFPMKYIPQKTKGKPYDKGVGTQEYAWLSKGNTHQKDIKLVNETGDRSPRSVVYFRTAESEGQIHPTQKPVGLFEYLIKTYTDEGDLVLDNCAGSGTTGVACLNTKRNFMLIEKDAGYCDAIEKRIQEVEKDIISNLF